MTNVLDGIDHLIIGVRDLEAARATYARLGFNTTPRGRHVGWGTANYCVMLANDYLELLGIVDASQFTNDLDRFLERREGLMGVALRSRDAAATHAAWAEAGLDPAPTRALGRLLETDGGIELRFRNVLLPAERTAGLPLFACEHLTADQLRRPAWLRHPNGAKAIKSCTVVVEEPAPVADAMARVFGKGAITETDEVRAVHTGQGVIVLARPEDAMLMHPIAAIEGRVDRPVPLVLTVVVDDPDRAARFLERQDVAFARDLGGDVLIAPADAHGVAIELTRG